jgi:hypothetical protein
MLLLLDPMGPSVLKKQAMAKLPLLKVLSVPLSTLVLLALLTTELPG